MLNVTFNVTGVGKVTIQGRAPSRLVDALDDFRDSRQLQYDAFDDAEIIDSSGTGLGRMSGYGVIRTVDSYKLAAIEYKEQVIRHNPGITNEEAASRMARGSLRLWMDAIPGDDPVSAALMCYAADTDPAFTNPSEEDIRRSKVILRKLDRILNR